MAVDEGSRPRGTGIALRRRIGITLASLGLAAGLRACPVTTVWAAVDRLSRPRRGTVPPGDAPGVARMLAAEIDAVLGSPVVGIRGRCLKRSLILYAMLHRRGLRPRWSLGHHVAADGAFAAHAWCSLGGAVVAEPPGTEGVHREMLARGG